MDDNAWVGLSFVSVQSLMILIGPTHLSRFRLGFRRQFKAIFMSYVLIITKFNFFLLQSYK